MAGAGEDLTEISQSFGGALHQEETQQVEVVGHERDEDVDDAAGQEVETEQQAPVETSLQQVAEDIAQ